MQVEGWWESHQGVLARQQTALEERELALDLAQGIGAGVSRLFEYIISRFFVLLIPFLGMGVF